MNIELIEEEVPSSFDVISDVFMSVLIWLSGVGMGAALVLWYLSSLR